jgi:sugar O-acyltransferase (sialic acid O-acetyltransferase NeuD family)
MKNLYIFGNGGHSKVVLDTLNKSEYGEILFVVESNPNLKNEILFDDFLKEVRADDRYFIALGDNYSRYKIVEKIQTYQLDIKPITIIHPTACVSNSATIGRGSIVCAMAILGPNTSVGQFCIINTAASLDHDNVLNDYSSIGPRVTTGGNVSIGENTFVGISTTILHGVQIGNNTVIGAHSYVNNNFKDLVVAFGVPAKVIRKRERDEKYL